METYLVQVWVPADGTAWHTELHGVVRHVATGVEARFRNDQEVLAFLRPAGPGKGERHDHDRDRNA